MSIKKPEVVGYIAKRDLEYDKCRLGPVCMAADPWPGSVALIRLSDYEELQAECERWKRGSEMRDEQNQDLHLFVMELKAENEKIRKDAERYRFLCDPVGADEDCLAYAINTLNSWADKTEIDQAVDYAMQERNTCFLGRGGR